MITVTGLEKTYRTGLATVKALGGVDLRVPKGAFFVLLGPSGSGKTTLLRCVAGLERPDSGEVAIGDRVVSSGKSSVFVPSEARGIGMVFQSYAVWPHMTVFQNVAFPITKGKKRLPKDQVRDKVRHALSLVKLEGLESRPAPQLSGGQQQRVALARAIVGDPQVLLMDEPLSNLDARLREEVREEIKEITKRLNITTLYVTHDQVEAMALGDTIAVMHRGAILQEDKPEALYLSPADKVVGQFLGAMNELKATVVGDGLMKTEVGVLACPPAEGLVSKEAVLAIRPEHTEVMAEAVGAENELEGELVSRTFLGETIVYQVNVGGVKVVVKTTKVDPRLQPGRRVYVCLPKDNLRVYRMSGE